MIINGKEVLMEADFNFWCPNKSKSPECNYCNNVGNLVLRVEEGPGPLGFPLPETVDNIFCPCNEEVKIKLVGRRMSSVKFEKMNNEQIKADRLSRSREHFKKEIFPTLDRDGQRHHASKNPELKPSLDISQPKVSAAAKKEITKAAKSKK